MKRAVYFAVAALSFLLLAGGFRVGVNAIFSIAASEENTILMERMARLGANVNQTEDINGTGNERSELDFAIEGNKIETVKKLLELGADCEAIDEQISNAQGEGFHEIARILKQHKASKLNP